MAWGTKVTATQLTSITTEQFFSFGGTTGVTLNPGETAQIQVAVDFPTTPVDDAIVALYTTLDASSETWDVVPFQQFVISRLNDPSRVTFVVGGVYKFRIGVRRSGTTNTLTSADCAYRKDGIAL